jgi:hypothetical protein
MSVPQGFVDANNDGVVLGLKSVAGVQPRVDIDQLLYEDPEVFNLFLLALKELQDPSNTKNIMGYFEIAGRPANDLGWTLLVLTVRGRYTRHATTSLGWRRQEKEYQGQNGLWVLRPQYRDLSNLAPALSCHVRGR